MLYYEQLTYKLRGYIFEASKELGAGFLEKVYENALTIELDRQGIAYKVQHPLIIHYKGSVVGEYIADLLVEDKVIVELKAVNKILPVHEAQLLNYLKATQIKLGLLVNFTYPKATIKRYVSN